MWENGVATPQPTTPLNQWLPYRYISSINAVERGTNDCDKLTFATDVYDRAYL